MPQPLSLTLDRTAKAPIAEQIANGIAQAIDNGVLLPGARLPSWLDLAAQLGVARGTVRLAYEKLTDAQLIVSSRTNGTHVADRPASVLLQDTPVEPDSIAERFRDMAPGAGIFRMGVPATDCFPTKLMARIRAHAVRIESDFPSQYPDARGELELRREIAAHLVISRGLACSPSQIFITSGFSGGLGLTLRVLGLEGRRAWIEDPCFPLTRKGLEIARLQVEPIPVDANGIDVDYGLQHASEAALAVITPGQQAPLGPTLPLKRRLQLLEWAAQQNAWIIEDDYLGELQLNGRAAPALASIDRAGRVIHIGSFSKTITPTLRLGFLVVPASLVGRFADAATCLSPAPGPAVQLAVAEFMRDGHYMRHLRRTKRTYAAKRNQLQSCVQPWCPDAAVAGLAILVRLPSGVSDVSIAKKAIAFGLGPPALSPWYMSPEHAQPGLLLGIATSPVHGLHSVCERLREITTQANVRTPPPSK